MTGRYVHFTERKKSNGKTYRRFYAAAAVYKKKKHTSIVHFLGETDFICVANFVVNFRVAILISILIIKLFSYLYINMYFRISAHFSFFFFFIVASSINCGEGKIALENKAQTKDTSEKDCPFIF